MSLFLERDLSGWGRFPVQKCAVARPERMRELGQILESSEATSLLPRGLGRSYGDTALNPSGVVLLEKLKNLLDFDAQTGLLHAQGGASLRDILDVFVPRGWFLPVVPGTRNVTVGGAIACDVHGKNHHASGCFSEFLEEFELLLASGETLVCSRAQNERAFWATIGGVGLTGIITSAKFRLKPIRTAFIYQTQIRTRDLDETLDALERTRNQEYTVAWIDGLSDGRNLGRGVVTAGVLAGQHQVESAHKLAYAATEKTPVPRDFPQGVLNRATISAFNALYYATHRSGEGLVDLETFFWPLDRVGSWNKIYGARGFVQYQPILPRETARQGLRKLLEAIAKSGFGAFLGVIKIHGPQNAAPLSYPLEGFSLALDFPLGDGVEAFCRELDKITLEFGGRHYLAKDSTTTPEAIRKMYPRLREWQEMRRELDPNHRFDSALARRLQLKEAF